jgi:cytochrome c
LYAGVPDVLTKASLNVESTALLSFATMPAFMRRAIRVVSQRRPRQVCATILGLVAACSIATPVPACAQVQTPQALLREYKCYICHADTDTKAGPAYVDVAARYRGKREAVAAIAAIIRNGRHGGGPWHMPPHPEVSDTDARAMARYILSLEPRAALSPNPAPAQHASRP